MKAPPAPSCIDGLTVHRPTVQSVATADVRSMISAGGGLSAVGTNADIANLLNGGSGNYGRKATNLGEDVAFTLGKKERMR